MDSFFLRLAIMGSFFSGFSACTAGNYDLPACQERELCGNGLDDDCDGIKDNEDICKCTKVDDRRPCPARAGIVTNATNPLSICTDEVQICLPNLQWSSCKGVDPIIEKCGNGHDDDCDGQVDDQDAEGCVKCVNGETQTLTNSNLTYGPKSICRQEIQDCQQGIWVTRPGSEAVGPQAADATCDGVDDDCDGNIDEDAKWRSFPLGSVCWDEAETGACRTAGTVGCSGGAATCNRVIQTRDDTSFHRFPASNVYTNVNINNAAWDRNCNGIIESIFCTGNADTCRNTDIVRTVHVAIDDALNCSIVRGSDLCYSVVIKPMPGESFIQCGSRVRIIECQLAGILTCGDSAVVKTGYLYCK